MMLLPHDLDRIDLNILASLQDYGRMTVSELSGIVGLSSSPCIHRIRRLEDAGYITGYGAILNPAALGEIVTVFTKVTLAGHRRADFSRFVALTHNVDEITECHLISGGYDYLLKFMTRSVRHYQRIIEGLIEAECGIERYFSYVVIKSPIIGRPCNIRKLVP